MKFCNANIYCSDFTFHHGGFEVENGRFKNVLGAGDGDCIDLQGAYVLPGLIDIHHHGNSGKDFSDGDYEGLKTIAGYLARHGITSFAPTSLTLPEETLSLAFQTAARLYREQPEGLAVPRGINMEGPFFSEAKKGAQNAAYLQKPDIALFERLNTHAQGLIKIMDIAPELDGAIELIRAASKTCTVSLAHTDASYEHALAAFDAGATHITHLFNAMPALNHRKPGVIGAAAEHEQVTAELIADGEHVHGSVVRAAYKLFGAHRLCLVSDALSCCGMPDGEYMLGGLKIRLKGTLARLLDGTIAGSANNLFGILHLAMGFGIPSEAAVRMATYNPACVLGLEREVGSIVDGLRADFLICNALWELEQVYLDGALLAP